MTNGIPALANMVSQLHYKTGWQFWLEAGHTGTAGGCPPVTPDTVTRALAPAMIAVTFGEPVRLVICVTAEDSMRPGQMASFGHRFDVPPDDSAMPWHWWLLSCIRSVETHEMCEAFAIGEVRPFYPEHGPGARLYEIWEHGLRPS
jgi:hypothetical protein